MAMNRQLSIIGLRLAATALAWTTAAARAQTMPTPVPGFDTAVPAEFSALVWAPVVLLAFGCIAGLLWLIASDRPGPKRPAVRRGHARLGSQRVARLSF